MIHERRGTMYEPEIADAFLRIVDELRQQPPTGIAPAQRPRTGAADRDGWRG